MMLRLSILAWLLVIWPFHLFAESTLDPQCVLELADSGNRAMTLAELREQCALAEREVTVAASEDDPAEENPPEEIDGPVEKRLMADRVAALRPFSLMAHKPNYFLAGVYNTRGWDPTLFQDQAGDPDLELDDIESQFQVSLKVPLAIGLLDDRMDVYAAYTNRSFWQVYNEELSKPFRETNHEPEVWAQFTNDWSVFGFANTLNTVGLVHQSNGRSGELSRSWNRLQASFLFEKRYLVLGFRPWIWIDTDKSGGDNPDIDEFMGHGEFRLAYGRGGHVLSAMIRNQIESGFDRGAVELSWSIPVFDYPYLKFYLQYFNGYGESLLDYDRKVNRIGIGISITDWLD